MLWGERTAGVEMKRAWIWVCWVSLWVGVGDEWVVVGVDEVSFQERRARLLCGTWMGWEVVWVVVVVELRV